MAMMRQAQIVGYASPEFGGTMVLQMARDTGWGYTRILGELKN